MYMVIYLKCKTKIKYKVFLTIHNICNYKHEKLIISKVFVNTVIGIAGVLVFFQPVIDGVSGTENCF